MRKTLLILPFLALGLFACKDDDKKDDVKPTPKPEEPAMTHNTKYTVTSDTPLDRIVYTTEGGIDNAVIIKDTSIREWSLQLDLPINREIKFEAEIATPNSGHASLDLKYIGEGRLDTISKSRNVQGHQKGFRGKIVEK